MWYVCVCVCVCTFVTSTYDMREFMYLVMFVHIFNALNTCVCLCIHACVCPLSCIYMCVCILLVFSEINVAAAYLISFYFQPFSVLFLISLHSYFLYSSFWCCFMHSTSSFSLLFCPNFCSVSSPFLFFTLCAFPILSHTKWVHCNSLISQLISVSWDAFRLIRTNQKANRPETVKQIYRWLQRRPGSKSSNIFWCLWVIYFKQS